jgi:hypothetical protein
LSKGAGRPLRAAERNKGLGRFRPSPPNLPHADWGDLYWQKDETKEAAWGAVVKPRDRRSALTAALAGVAVAVLLPFAHWVGRVALGGGEVGSVRTVAGWVWHNWSENAVYYCAFGLAAALYLWWRDKRLAKG